MTMPIASEGYAAIIEDTIMVGWTPWRWIGSFAAIISRWLPPNIGIFSPISTYETTVAEWTYVFNTIDDFPDERFTPYCCYYRAISFLYSWVLLSVIDIDQHAWNMIFYRNLCQRELMLIASFLSTAIEITKHVRNDYSTLIDCQTHWQRWLIFASACLGIPRPRL